MPDPIQVAVVPAPVADPKPPLFNPDVIMALALGTVSLVSSTFTTDPHLTLVLQLLSGELTLVAGVLHLDGK